jgi:dTDP-4-amino-4,6-dideoxygalactose transaminase
MNINFVDLKAQYLTIKTEIDGAIQAVIEKSAFAAGPFVKSFEDNFAERHQAKYCVGVNSGTSALHIAMWALGLGPGDEVIVPANTFFATAEAVSLCGATPVFVDCEASYFNIDPQKIEEALSPKTRAIIPVHLYGQAARMDEVRSIAAKHGLAVIEDCAQAHLTEYEGRKVGTFGTCGCFSFYPGKNLGAYGEGGAVLTNDESLYEKMMALRDHGSSKKYYHDYVGHNYRMEGLQGAVLDVKLKHLEHWTQKRRGHADLYRRLLSGIGHVEVPQEMPEGKHVYHLFVVKTQRRTELINHLRNEGIATGIHYPVPCHLQKAYAHLPRRTPLPVSEELAHDILSLPMYAELAEEDIRYICNQIKEFYDPANGELT